MTNHRISVFNQDVIPHILRTKLIPALEDEENVSYQQAKELELTKTFDVHLIFFNPKSNCRFFLEKIFKIISRNQSTITKNQSMTAQI
jgi:hypothetical protein